MKIKVFLIIDSLILLALIIGACIFSSSYFNGILKPKYYTVNFNTKGGNKLPSAQVLQGTRVEKPDDPIKDGYIFSSWQYYDKDWNFNFQVVNENMTLIAVWKAIE